MEQLKKDNRVIALLLLILVSMILSIIYWQNNQIIDLKGKLYSQGNSLNFYKEKYQFGLINDAIIYQISEDYCEAYDELYLADSIVKLNSTGILFMSEMKEKCNNIKKR